MPWYLIDVLETTQRSFSYRIFRETEDDARYDAQEAGGFDDPDEEIELIDEDHDLPVRKEIIDCRIESPTTSDIVSPMIIVGRDTEG
jgi:hypothetical protein